MSSINSPTIQGDISSPVLKGNVTSSTLKGNIESPVIKGNISSPTLNATLSSVVVNGTIPSSSHIVGTTNYEQLYNKPQINSIEIIGNKTGDYYKLVDSNNYISNTEINNLFQ